MEPEGRTVGKMNKILSIVVPSYNVEAYLDRCLDSFVVPELLNDVEVLVIDDDSRDGTAEIARSYCERYPNTFFLYSKENGGHGSTINAGIRAATGKYYRVVDGDDWLNSAELLKFVETLRSLDADVVASDFQSVRDGTFEVMKDYPCVDAPELYGTTVDLTRTEISKVVKMHSLTIKTAILREHNVTIDEHCFYVDAEYITFPMPFVRTVFFYRGFLYQYRLGRSGQSMDIRSMQRNRMQHMRVLNSLLDFYSGLGELPPSQMRYIERCIAQVVENQFQIYISMGLQAGIRAELADFDRRLKKDYPAIGAATEKKSITLLRATNYLILPVGALVYKLVK